MSISQLKQYDYQMPNDLKFPITGDPAADILLEKEPLALVIGMLLDQQITMEWAFKGPLTIKERIGFLDAQNISSMEESKFLEVCSAKPAIHRFPKAMAARIQELCTLVAQDYNGDVSKVWRGQKDAKEVLKRLQKLPGFGAEKSKIFLAILVKRFGYSYVGYEKVAAPYSDSLPRSAASVCDAASLELVRQFKKEQKAKVKAAKTS